MLLKLEDENESPADVIINDLIFCLPNGEETTDLSAAIEEWRKAGYNITIKVDRAERRLPYYVLFCGPMDFGMFGETVAGAVARLMKATYKNISLVGF